MPRAGVAPICWTHERLRAVGPRRSSRATHQTALPSSVPAEAIELARTSGKTIPELAQDLGVSGQTLRNWLHQADVDAGRGRPGELTTAEREELRRLRRENQVLRQEREILKKAAAFFARETTR
jgi:transposase